MHYSLWESKEKFSNLFSFLNNLIIFFRFDIRLKSKFLFSDSRINYMFVEKIKNKKFYFFYHLRKINIKKSH